MREPIRFPFPAPEHETQVLGCASLVVQAERDRLRQLFADAFGPDTLPTLALRLATLRARDEGAAVAIGGVRGEHERPRSASQGHRRPRASLMAS